ncbi:MAG: VWA domain-containing protein [Myxococcales bacterium]|nr:VWA domain-containing protein [Myxococcales bacterium]
MTARKRWIAVLWAVSAAGCGAKSGLEVPDAVAPDALCVEVPADGGTVPLDLQTNARLVSADVVFLIDTSSSMGREIAAIRSGIRERLAPAFQAEIPDVAIGVAEFVDFPVRPHGGPNDIPFAQLQPVTTDLRRVQEAVDQIELRNGLDEPESQVEALYQLATGEGLGAYVPPALACPKDHVAYPCFRPSALHVVLLFTDQEFHNDSVGGNPYQSIIVPGPHSYDDAVAALAEHDIRVIGFESGGGAGLRDLTRLAMDTGAVDGAGEALVFDIGVNGGALDTRVVDAMKRVANDSLFDVLATVRDPSPDDGIDVTAFVESVMPVSASPAEGVQGIEEDRFLGVSPGTELSYRIVLRPNSVPAKAEAQVFPIEIVFSSGEGAGLGVRLINLVIPALDGTGC